MSLPKDGKVAIAYRDLDGTKRLLDCSDVVPEDPAERNSLAIPHIAQALRRKDEFSMRYLKYLRSQKKVTRRPG